MSVVVLLRSCLGAPILLAVLAIAPHAAAEEKEADLERARALYDEAGELERKGQWPAAQERLREAIRIRETPHLRYALAWALENNDKLLEARTEYELALRLAQRAGNDEVTRLATTRITEVDRKTPLVQLRIRGPIAADTRVLVDGREVAIRADGGTYPVDPGTRIVRVERTGKTAAEQSVAMQHGSIRVVEITGDDALSVTGDSRVQAEGPRGASSSLPWVFVAGGGALVVGGALLFASSASDVSTRDESMRLWCDATSCSGGNLATRPETAEAAAYRREAFDAASRGNAKQIVGGVLGGVGAVGVAVGVYMLVKKGGHEEPERAGKVRIDATPLLGGGLAGASVTF